MRLCVPSFVSFERRASCETWDVSRNVARLRQCKPCNLLWGLFFFFHFSFRRTGAPRTAPTRCTPSTTTRCGTHTSTRARLRANRRCRCRVPSTAAPLVSRGGVQRGPFVLTRLRQWPSLRSLWTCEQTLPLQLLLLAGTQSVPLILRTTRPMRESCFGIAHYPCSLWLPCVIVGSLGGAGTVPGLRLSAST